MRRQTNVVRQLVALPADARAWIERQAEHHLTPMNSIILAAIRTAMAAENQHQTSCMVRRRTSRAERELTVAQKRDPEEATS
jgi:hypothetical protein